VPVTNDNLSKSDHSETARQVYESVVMQPVFLGQEQAIGYAKGRARFGSGEIRILD
jgi:hypothetical protein